MLTRTVSVADAKEVLSELVEQALQGNEILLSADEQLVQLVPVSTPLKERTPGLNRGEVWMSEDFDTPLPDEFWIGEP